MYPFISMNYALSNSQATVCQSLKPYRPAGQPRRHTVTQTINQSISQSLSRSSPSAVLWPSATCHLSWPSASTRTRTHTFHIFLVLTDAVGKQRKPSGTVTATVVTVQAWNLYGCLKSRGRGFSRTKWWLDSQKQSASWELYWNWWRAMSLYPRCRCSCAVLREAG